MLHGHRWGWTCVVAANTADEGGTCTVAVNAEDGGDGGTYMVTINAGAA